MLTVFLFGTTLGQFAILDNLQQRNIELMEFILLLAAFLSLKFRREWTAGSLLCLAALAKLLPFVFFPLLVIRKNYKGMAAYASTFLVIIGLSEVLLGWSNYQMFQPGTAITHGVPGVSALLGGAPITELSHLRGSFYTFILSFFADIDLSRYIPGVRLRITNFALPNWIFLAVIGLVIAGSFWRIWKNRSDLLFDFAVLALLMLIVFPRCNPHYYVFALFGVYFVLRTLLEPGCQSRVWGRYNNMLAIPLVVSYVMLGGILPFWIYDKALESLGLGMSFFHVMAVYGIQGLAAFVLWLTVVVSGPITSGSEQERPLLG